MPNPSFFLVSNWTAKNKTSTCSFFFSSDMRQVTRGIASFNLRYMSNSRRFKRAHETLQGWMSFSWEPKKWQVLTLLFVCFSLCFRWPIWSAWKSSCLPRPRGEQWNKWTVQFFVITLNSYLLQIELFPYSVVRRCLEFGCNFINIECHARKPTNTRDRCFWWQIADCFCLWQWTGKIRNLFTCISTCTLEGLTLSRLDFPPPTKYSFSYTIRVKLKRK